METDFKALLDKDFDASKEIEKNVMDVFMAEDWTNYPIGKRGAVQLPVDTKYDLAKLKELAIKMSTLPADKKFINKITRLFENRSKLLKPIH
jgi:2-oxoglutarate dehydrogenase E1 component